MAKNRKPTYRIKHIELPTGVQMTVASTHYGGLRITGTACCHPDDTYNEYLGELLAMMRCDVKTYKKKVKRAWKEYYKAVEATEAAERREAKMLAYFNDSTMAYNQAVEDLENLEKTLDSGKIK